MLTAGTKSFEMLDEMAFDNFRENPAFVRGKKVEFLGSSQNSEVN